MRIEETPFGPFPKKQLLSEANSPEHLRFQSVFGEVHLYERHGLRTLEWRDVQIPYLADRKSIILFPTSTASSNLSPSIFSYVSVGLW